MCQEQLIPEGRFVDHPLCHGWQVEQKRAGEYTKGVYGVVQGKRYKYTFELIGVSLLAVLIGGMAVNIAWPHYQPVGQTNEPPLALPVAGPVDEATAARNLAWLEAHPANSDVNVPAGVYWFSRAPRLKTGWRLRGAGMDRTSIVNKFNTSWFGDNCSLQILQGQDPGFGYADGMTLMDRVGRRNLTLTDPAAAVNYPSGTLVWTWKWDGYFAGLGQTHVRCHRVANQNGQRLTLDSEADAEANVINYARRGSRIQPAAEGTNRLTATEKLPAEFTLNRQVRVTAGPTSANEMVGEDRRITSIIGNVIELDRPLRQSYGASAAVIAYDPVHDVTVSDLTIAAPPASSTTYFATATGLTFERCRIEGDLCCALCSDVTVRDCRIAETLYFNATREATANDVRARHGYCEEQCSDVMIRNTLFRNAKGVGFLSNPGAPSDRITLQNVVIENASDAPLVLGGRESLVDTVTVIAAKPGFNSYFAGDDATVRSWRSESPLVIPWGNRMAFSDVRGRLILGWPGWTWPVGSVVQCASVDASRLPAEVKQQWQFAANAPSNVVAGSAGEAKVPNPRVRGRPRPATIK